MIFSKDSEFLEALESAEALDQRLAQLQKQRKVYLALHIFGFFGFLFCCFVSLMAKQLGTASLMATMILLLMALHQLAALVSAQNDIRTLLAFKKLRDQNGPAN